MNKENVVCLYNGILFSNKNKWSTDAYYHMDTFKKFMQVKEANHKAPHRAGSVYMKCPSEANL